MRRDERLQRHNHLLRAAEREQRFEPLLGDKQPLRLKPLAFQAREGLVEYVRQRGAAPQGKRLLSGTKTRRRVVLAACRFGKPLEASEVERLFGEPEAEATAVRRQQALSAGGRERLAQPRDVDIECVRSGRGRMLAPEGVDQRSPWDGAVSVEQ